MKYIFLLLSVLGIAPLAIGQDIEGVLTEKIKLLDKSYKNTELQPLANDFERIALADATNWLANYYTAYVNVRIADQSSGSTIDSYCDQAEKYLKIAEKAKGANASEIYALYAYLYSAKVKVNPMFRGAKYGKMSREYSEKSIKENPNNPRPYLIRAIGIFFTPKAFGGGPAKAKPFLDKAFEKFDSFTPETANSPHWGKGMAEYLKKSGN